MTLRVSANGMDIAYESLGSPGDRPLLLIMGLGSQLIQWDDAFCALLVEQGHHVIRFDNRDVGLSTHLDDLGVPDLGAVVRDPAKAPYLLADMAADAAGLLTAIGWPAAHVVGASMGGMVAQQFAVDFPQMVLSLTSIMSTPGSRIGPPTPEASAALGAPPARDREAAIAQALETWRVIGSPGYEFDEDYLRDSAGRAYDRDHHPQGAARQLAAILASPDRSERLRGLTMPALVIHGESDPLVGLAGGQATAAAIPGAKLMTFPGMGHDLPRPLWKQIIGEISELTAS